MTVELRRNLPELAARPFDLVVIGGGITGAFTAWDAALRGLSVALLERGDFGGATSAASSKVIHGGIRHLQKGEIGRVQESIRERAVFARIAPHLVHRVPFLIPTYGHGMRGKEVLRTGMLAYEVLALGQNRHLGDPERRIARHQVLSRRDALALEPGLEPRGLTGGVRYEECHLYSSERMTLAVVQAAAAAGAVVANYVEVSGFLRAGERISGVRARDRLPVLARGGEGAGEPEFEVQAKLVANITGPWAPQVDALLDRQPARRFALSKGCHLVTRPITRSGAVAFATAHKHEGLVNRGGRHFFVIPWRGCSLIGTTNVPYTGDPAAVGVTEKDVSDFLVELNAGFPAGALTRGDVRHAFAGLYPLVDKEVRAEVYQGASKYEIYDHAPDGVQGLITVIGAKYTTARNLARQAVDLVFRKRGETAPVARTAATPVAGGGFDRVADLLAAVHQDRAGGGAALEEDIARDLAFNYGADYRLVTAEIERAPEARARLTADRPTIRAMVRHAVKREMALRLSDVVFRRTGLGTIGHPGDAALQMTAAIMAEELAWDGPRMERELAACAVPFRVTP
jgi:glycerol-3-phosphate dehydrogenase